MTTLSLSPQVQSLVALSHLYPSMRLGQIVEMGLSFVTEERSSELDGIEGLWTVACQSHLIQRCRDLGIAPRLELASLPNVREELLSMVADWQEHHPGEGLFRLVQLTSWEMRKAAL